MRLVFVPVVHVLRRVIVPIAIALFVLIPGSALAAENEQPASSSRSGTPRLIPLRPVQTPSPEAPTVVVTPSPTPETPVATATPSPVATKAPAAPTPPPKPSATPQASANRPAGISERARWIDVDLSEQRLRAYEGDRLVFEAPVTTGKAGFSTPVGTFRIFSRVYNETMDSQTLGTPRSDSEGYLLEDVMFTQYFLDGGFAIHTNYWQPVSVFGRTPTSHGCVGMRLADAERVWNFASIGTAVNIHY